MVFICLAVWSTYMHAQTLCTREGL